MQALTSLAAHPRELRLARWLFLRGVAVVFVIAFASLAMQLDGLIGRDGILPAADFAARVAARLSGARFTRLPTLVWWTGASDPALRGLCYGGLAASLAAAAGVVPMASLCVAWCCYLSLFNVGQDFLGFQWDLLLLETGLLAVGWAPLALRHRRSDTDEPSRPIAWLVRLLAFKLMLLSGIAKLASGDPAWRDLTALTYHFETQPLPTWIGWFVHHLPRWLLVAACGATLVVELALPWAIFAGRWGRRIACAGFVALMVGIGLTGNYTFFNLLTVVISLVLLDDDDLRALVPAKWRARSDEVRTAGSSLDGADRPPRARTSPIRWPTKLLSVAPWTRRAFALVLATANLGMFVGGPPGLVWRMLVPLSSVNHYGLFAVMTRERPEITIEGSDDGVEWRAYVLPWKPGPVDRRPGFVEPHQPRLDWQLWFAALSPASNARWVERLLERLHEGSPPVLALFAVDPFPDAPPRYVRATIARYHESDWRTLRATGAWWARESPPLPYLVHPRLPARAVESPGPVR